MAPTAPAPLLGDRFYSCGYGSPSLFRCSDQVTILKLILGSLNEALAEFSVLGGAGSIITCPFLLWFPRKPSQPGDLLGRFGGESRWRPG
jgi:hypothetical protein